MYKYSYFLLASELEISQMKSLDDVCLNIERTEPIVGNVSLEAITSLSKVFLDDEHKKPVQTSYFLKDGSPFYKVDCNFCEKIASTNHEDLLNASVPWSAIEPWKDTDVNRMDLAGWILDIAALCKQTKPESFLFMLLSNEN